MKRLITTFLFSLILNLYLYPQKERNISITGVGDIMLGTNFPSKKYLPKNCSSLLSNISSVLSSSDITFGNLEGCISDNAKLVKTCKDSTKCYAFRMPNKFGACLKSIGLDVVSIANNHIMDFGIEGLNNTRKILKSLDIEYAGTIEDPYTIFVKDSITYGFCAFSPNKGTQSINNYQEAVKIVNLLNEKCDIVIASFHGGAEGKEHQHITKEIEFYYGENRGNVYKFSHELIDAGADIIFGHGPHVTRAIELYKNRFIAYSLGNFCTFKRFNLKGVNGISPIIKIDVNRLGEFQKGKIIPVKQIQEGIPIIDTSKEVIKKIQELTNDDFKFSKLVITDKGEILKKNEKR